VIVPATDSGGRAVEDVGLRPLDSWDRGFESRLRHGCSSFLFVVWCVGIALYDKLVNGLGEP